MGYKTHLDSDFADLAITGLTSQTNGVVIRFIALRCALKYLSLVFKTDRMNQPRPLALIPELYSLASITGVNRFYIFGGPQLL